MRASATPVPSLSFTSLSPVAATPMLAMPASFPLAASDRLLSLVSEFRSLQEPIERVKRLLDYAAVLPAFEDSSRMDSNRVPGCTAQVWVDVGMDGQGRMRFWADSDSEIAKGFCSCLMDILDRAKPQEVMGMRAEELRVVNIGIVAHSRVNTWHHILVRMQSRTQELLNVPAMVTYLPR
ncbi:hypothetical protein MLD38_025492 [Melastoma candidum]|uniref:Uncharacterized protein n=1 Tax=Melastoma candidum TaxID=119954 RepID=A0ACB9NYF6_9MYRT|nr:hypothetical protein MLD38_025492 [Melastoma candidum]